MYVNTGTENGMVKFLLDIIGLSCTVPNATLAIIRDGEYQFSSMLMLAWTIIADIDIESEKHRWMGSAQIDFYLRRYNGRIKYLAATGNESFGEPAEPEGETISEGYHGLSLNMKEFNHKIEGPFISFWLHNVPWEGQDALAAPDAKVALLQFSDGYLDLVVIKECQKLTLLFLMTELNKGGM
ncbi:hypothetical protein T459_19234 [Capsicum annuum]|uniref:Uncharacterized protein n=1 Tax=Capsicum annuum TaxID=4072 RepID=A0A2G2Z121_CAPAN|nr:hypothetical protein T459_19234 [Capsicum annuum]